MPRAPREDEIVAAIREYLKEAVKGKERITDGRLMKAARCSRATFYRYVTPDSQIRREIGDAKRLQKKRPPSDGEEPEDDPWEIIRALRKEVEDLKEALRGEAAFTAKFVSNLSERGVWPDVLQAAQTDAMSHPDRRYPGGGRSRSRQNRGRKNWCA
jgi:hypothetical protein